MPGFARLSQCWGFPPRQPPSPPATSIPAATPRATTTAAWATGTTAQLCRRFPLCSNP